MNKFQILDIQLLNNKIALAVMKNGHVYLSEDQLYRVHSWNTGFL